MCCHCPSLPDIPHEQERNHLVGAVLGKPQVPGLLVPAVTLLAVPPSAFSQLERSEESIGEVAGPNFTAVCLAFFLTQVAV